MDTAVAEPMSEDSGFGLIEIVVSMMMLAILSLCLLPLLITGVKQSAKTATMATATQLVQQQMESARTKSTCAALSSSLLTPTTTTSVSTDSRGVAMTQTQVVGPCPITAAILNGKVSVSSTVTRSDGTVLATATTYVFVTA